MQNRPKGEKMAKVTGKVIEVNHETRDGEHVSMKFKIDAKMATSIKNNGRVVVDVTNNALKFYDYNSGTTKSLARAVVEMSGNQVRANRVTYVNGDSMDLRISNLNF
jgi:hypothetical protein